jgi:hypothetical protein
MKLINLQDYPNNQNISYIEHVICDSAIVDDDGNTRIESSETMVNNTELSGSPISVQDLDKKVKNLQIDPKSDSLIATPEESSSDPKVKNLQIDPNSDSSIATPEESSSDPKVKNLQNDPNPDSLIATPEESSSDPKGEHV